MDELKKAIVDELKDLTDIKKLKLILSIIHKLKRS